MGAAHLSEKEPRLDNPYSKKEFPKIRAEHLGEEDVIEIRAKKDFTDEGAGYLRYAIAILVAQIVIFFATVVLIQSSKMNTRQPPDASGQQADHAAGNDQKIQSAAARPMASPKQEELIVAQFDHHQLATELGGQVKSIIDPMTANALTLGVDEANKFGSTGGSLRVNFAFKPNLYKPASFVIELPNTDLSKYSKISMRMKTATVVDRAPKAEVDLLGTKNEHITFGVADVFTFWKTYTFDLRTEASKLKLNALSALRINLYSLGQESAGTWYIDEIKLSA
ncbi:MAG: hypothetical protein COV74_01665 [Candidatus Omnitrophica bacterium CG11_big_fil_rev_8_21_14_0_20_45_26]|uniref:CBM11 domain-containing protein n=1 Tax=Candidatus Abzuiibacterium crystallinum TaxID=1974748 RepID=A0A2H0LUA6_9BACT|nr:MAG: hypothetical protein COV74_01665 [Candidatus Omnitrophica bacterium CG11_big_fil_rev_8_21_14_0_20_45_26]PIW65003.1 MAG: hypothetical protein COW12_03945 [Candidatus Omnitrophica bacterium CG12_big_fil_rev_8_21_14_0_65_45_16]